jgi:hypothetical protein
VRPRRVSCAVNRTIAELAPLIAGAPVDAKIRAAWLDRLFEAHAADQIPYIERLAEYWGELCGTREHASEWADRLINITRLRSRRTNRHVAISTARRRA